MSWTVPTLLTWPEQCLGWRAAWGAAARAHRRPGALVLVGWRRCASRSNSMCWICPAAAWCGWTAQLLSLARRCSLRARLLANPSPSLRRPPWARRTRPAGVPTGFIDARDRASGQRAAILGQRALRSVHGLGYVDAMHRAPGRNGGRHGADLLHVRLGNDPSAGRHALLERSWAQWLEDGAGDLDQGPLDIRPRLRRIELIANGHAHEPSRTLRCWQRRLGPWLAAGAGGAAHSDLSAYSVFEGGYHWGLRGR